MSVGDDVQTVRGGTVTLPTIGRRSSELAQGWRLLLASMLGLAVGAHSLPFYTAGLFMAPLTRDFGWTRAQISVGPLILTGILAIMAPFVGAAIDRFGARRIGIPALACVALGFVGLSFIGGGLPVFYAIFALMAFAGSGSSTPTWTRIINQAFRERRGTALGVGLIGSGLASTLSPILLTSVIIADGWQAAYRWLAVVTGVAMLLIIVLTRALPKTELPMAKAVSQQGVGLAAALRDPVFWKLAVSFVCVAVASSGLIVHFVPLLMDDGVTPTHAAALASVIGISIILARLLTGFLMDVFFAPYVAAAMVTASACGFMALAIGGPSYAVAGAVAIGLSFGAEFDFVSYLCARYFGMRAYGRLYGILYGTILAGTSASPLIYGQMHQANGSYVLMLYVASAALLASACIFLTMRRFGSTPESASMPKQPG